jgi:hypothetical protein
MQVELAFTSGDDVNKKTVIFLFFLLAFGGAMCHNVGRSGGVRVYFPEVAYGRKY